VNIRKCRENKLKTGAALLNFVYRYGRQYLPRPIRGLARKIETRLKGIGNEVKPRGVAGNLRYCNICRWQGRRFNSFYNARMHQHEESICPNCGSQPRQRALFKHLRSEFLATYLYAIKEKGIICLEIGPGLSPVEKALKGVVYISVDLEDPCVMYQMDLTKLIFKDFTFDLVVCSHVLEHIEDDLLAIGQIYRVLQKDGTALIQIPIGCYEDPLGKCTMEFGKRRFYEHCRSYGWDFNERLIEAGFKVNVIRFANYDSSQLGIEKEAIFECKKQIV